MPRSRGWRERGTSLLATAKRCLEEQLQGKLEFPRVERASDSAEVAGTEVVADTAVVNVTLELYVVPGVEGFHAELNAATAFRIEHEVLKERQVPVVSAGAANCVERQIPVSSGSWGRKVCRVEPLLNGVGIGDGTIHVWPVGGIGNYAGNVLPVHSQVDRSSRFRGNDPGQCPSTSDCAQSMVVTVL